MTKNTQTALSDDKHMQTIIHFPCQYDFKCHIHVIGITQYTVYNVTFFSVICTNNLTANISKSGKVSTSRC